MARPDLDNQLISYNMGGQQPPSEAGVVDDGLQLQCH